MLKREQPESIEAYSAALRERLAGVLPPDKVEEVVAETECHLEERAQELRWQSDLFEKQAVTEFIPARKLARGINRAWAATYMRHAGTRGLQNISAAVCVLALLFILAQYLIISKLPLILQNQNNASNLILPVPFLVFCLALAACRPQLRRFTYGGLGAVVLFTLLGGWLCSGGTFWQVSRFDAPAHYKDAMAMRQHLQKEERLLQEGIGFYRSAFSRQDVELGKKLNAELLEKLTQLGWQSYSPNTPTSRKQRLQQDIQVARQQVVDYEAKKQWAAHSPQPPAALLVGNRYLVPKSHGNMLDISAFRNLSPEERRSMWAENPGMHQRSQALVAAWQKTQPESTGALTEAMLRWRTEGPEQLENLQSHRANRQKDLQRDMTLMASSKWRFEMAAARSLGILGLYCVGALLVADALGGFLGMLLLRSVRRQRLRSGKVA